MVIDLFHYREDDIFAMTDEEKNAGTERWPSKENIVSYSFFFSRGPGVLAAAHSLTLAKINKSSSGPWTILLEMQLPEMPSSSIVRFCATLSSSVDLISIDAGHGGRNDVEGNHACACRSDLSRCLLF